jgi:hypothetical protein
MTAMMSDAVEATAALYWKASMFKPGSCGHKKGAEDKGIKKSSS